MLALNDNSLDVVIGAPYEEDRGAVYVYLGGAEGISVHPATVYWQRIAASDFPHPLDALRGFGISLSAADVDDNGYPGSSLKRIQCARLTLLIES